MNMGLLEEQFLIDAHVHLQNDPLREDLHGVLHRAKEAGVHWMICNATRPADWSVVRSLCEQHSHLLPAYGVHPWYADDCDAEGRWLETLRDLLTGSDALLGEIGLDRWIQPRDETRQEEVFLAQLGLARDLNRPVVIHCLHAWGWLDELLRAHDPPSCGFMIHAYGGSTEMVEQLAPLGAYFSFAGNALRANHTKARDAVRAVPAERLLLETDAPDLLPPPGFQTLRHSEPDGHEVNEPANLPGVLRGIAALRDEDAHDLARQILCNAQTWLGHCRFEVQPSVSIREAR